MSTGVQRFPEPFQNQQGLPFSASTLQRDWAPRRLVARAVLAVFWEVGHCVVSTDLHDWGLRSESPKRHSFWPNFASSCLGVIAFQNTSRKNRQGVGKMGGASEFRLAARVNKRLLTTENSALSSKASNAFLVSPDSNGRRSGKNPLTTSWETADVNFCLNHRRASAVGSRSMSFTSAGLKSCAWSLRRALASWRRPRCRRSSRRTACRTNSPWRCRSVSNAPYL
jgi:hypothetical protein